MHDSHEIILALEQQLLCYQRLAKLADVQREHVQQGDAEALLGVLQRRQGVLDELSRLERVVGPVKREWAIFTAGLCGRREHVEALMVQARQLLQQITQADQDDVMLLQQRKLSVGRQLNQAAASRQVNRAYAASAYGKRPANMDVSK